MTTTASGTLTYSTPCTSARTEAGQDAYSGAIGSYSNYTTSAHPNTGNVIEGWNWDERVWTDHSVENAAAFVPTNWDPTTSGITESYFQSGIGSNRDLELRDIQFIPSSGLNEEYIYRLWSPEINHGYYYDYEEQGYLFSDDSEVRYPTYSGVVEGLGLSLEDGYNIVTLSGLPKVGVPIIAHQYQWNQTDGKYEVYLSLNKRINFTGVRDAGLVRQSTYNSNSESIIWDNIDKEFNEFLVTFSGVTASGGDPKAIFNQQYVSQVGAGYVTPTGLDTLGTTDGSANQQFHLTYSPVDDSMGVEVYSYLTTSGIITQWEAVPFDTTLSGYQVKLDPDFGILEFGDSTISGQVIPSGGSTIGARYWKTLRLEYEAEETNDTTVGLEANLNPIYRRSGEGFVYLATVLEDPASITLEANLDEIQTDVFGPLSIGSAFASLVATVKDARENVLEGQTVTFFITSEPEIGSFGSADTTTSVTDEYGEALAYYNPPRNIDDIGEEVTASGWSNEVGPTDPTYSGIAEITTLRTENILIQGEIEDIFTYKVYTDDPTVGYYDTSLEDDTEVQASGYYVQFFDNQAIYGATRDVDWEDTHRMIWELTRPTIYQADQGMGRRQLVSIVDSSLLNPYTFTYGAVGPMQPVNVESVGGGEYDVVFDTSLNSIPQPRIGEADLQSYLVVAPTTVSLQASVFNSRLNRTILSNEIEIKLSIPPYMSGLWTIDSINQSHIDEISSVLASGITASGQRVPLGWRLRSSNVTLAAALDGITFLDLNRQYNYDPWDADNVSGIRLRHQVTISGVS